MAGEYLYVEGGGWSCGRESNDKVCSNCAASAGEGMVAEAAAMAPRMDFCSIFSWIG